MANTGLAVTTAAATAKTTYHVRRLMAYVLMDANLGGEGMIALQVSWFAASLRNHKETNLSFGPSVCLYLFLMDISTVLYGLGWADRNRCTDTYSEYNISNTISRSL